MKKLLASLGMAMLIAAPFTAGAAPEQDLEDFRAYYADRFPNTPFDDFINGVYSIDAASRPSTRILTTGLKNPRS